MGKFDKYRKRLTRNGTNVGHAYASNTIAFIEATFASSTTFRVLKVKSTQFPDIKEIDARVVEVERLGTLREVLFRHNQGLDIGTYVEFDENIWLITDKWGSKESFLKVMVQKCNRTLKWKEGSDIREIDCIASANPLGSKANQGKNEIEYNQYDVSLQSGQMFCFVELNDITEKIKVNQRFIFGSHVYEVVGLDDTSTVDKNGFGILQMTLNVTTERSTDDFENRIAYNQEEPTTSEDNTSTGDEGGMIW
jgi:hypothetical protein